MTAALNKPGAIDLPPTAAGPATSSRVPGTDAMAAVPPVGAAPFATTALVAPGLLPLAGPPASVAPSGALADDTPDTGLVLAESVDPRFPPTLMTRLRKGHVEVRFDVAADGHVESASVEHASNHGLEPAALDAVRQWRFKPGKRGHAAVVDLAFDMDS
jgi:protein TonB